MVKRALGVVLVGALGVYWFAVFGAKPKPLQVVAAASEQEPATPSTPPRALETMQPAAYHPPVGAAPASTAAPNPDPNHEAMQALRSLFEADPEAALQAARVDASHFPNSPDAAERSWVIVRALSRLGRFDEARAEATLAVQTYPDTAWASDIQRHVLANPP